MDIKLCNASEMFENVRHVFTDLKAAEGWEQLQSDDHKISDCCAECHISPTRHRQCLEFPVSGSLSVVSSEEICRISADEIKIEPLRTILEPQNGEN